MNEGICLCDQRPAHLIPVTSTVEFVHNERVCTGTVLMQSLLMHVQAFCLALHAFSLQSKLPHRNHVGLDMASCAVSPAFEPNCLFLEVPPDTVTGAAVEQQFTQPQPQGLERQRLPPPHFRTRSSTGASHAFSPSLLRQWPRSRVKSPALDRFSATCPSIGRQ